MPSFRPLVSFCLLPLVFFLALGPSAAQSSSPDSLSLEQIVREFADRISSIPNFHGPCRLEFFQDANFSAETGNDWHDVLRAALDSHHISVSEDPAAPPLRVGIAETPAQLVLSASVRLADKEEVRLLTFPRASFRRASLPVSPVRLEKQLVYQTPEHLLDASSFWNGATTGMAVLIYRNAALEVTRVDSSGAPQETFPLAAAGPLISRDPRAELSLQSESVTVELPGKTCQFHWDVPAETKCHATKSAWRAPTILTPACGSTAWKLQADGQDWNTADLLQALPDNSAQKGSATVVSDFPGPILGINGEQNPTSALVVTRNLRTGNYEVYKITLACGN